MGVQAPVPCHLWASGVEMGWRISDTYAGIMLANDNDTNLATPGAWASGDLDNAMDNTS